MAFFDSPEVDENAKRSDKSVLEVRLILSQDNGFISREEKPDYGVDLDVELIREDKSASSQQFPVQVKSAIKFDRVSKNGEPYLGFSFKTSRLGYLARRDFGVGLIIFYDEHSRKCYYDYVANIINRVDAFHAEEEWRLQEKVTIHISESSLLDERSAVEIHEKICTQYDRHFQLLNAHGAQYNLPCFASALPDASTSNIDFNSPAQVADFLTTYGGVLFNNQDYVMLESLLASLPIQVVSNSSSLCFLAVITYGQVGDFIAGDYHLAKIQQHLKQFDSESLRLIEFTRARLRYLRGDLDITKLTEQINALAVASSNPLNSLVLRNNALYFTIVNNLEEWAISEDELAAHVDALFADITAANLLSVSERNLLILYNSENLHALSSSAMLRDGLSLKLAQVAGLQIGEAERMTLLKKSIDRLSAAQRYALDAYQYALDNNDRHLQASAAHNLSRYFFSLAFDKMMLQIDQEQALTPEVKHLFTTNLNHAGEAYNLFSGLGLWKDAHGALCTYTELQNLFQALYRQVSGSQTAEGLQAQLSLLEEKYGLQPFHSTVIAAHQKLTAALNSIDNWRSIDEEGGVDAFARRILKLYNLPEERLPHIIADVTNHALFEAECKNPNIQLLNSVGPLPNPHAYEHPSTYVLQSRRTGLTTPPRRDVRTLLDEFQGFAKTN